VIADPEALKAASNWLSLSRWERAELRRSLRLSGWTYGEIMELLPVGKGTLSGWCKEIRLSQDQIEAIKARVPSQKGVPKDTNWRRRQEVEAIRAEARESFMDLRLDPRWVAGVIMYWAEGAKTTPRLGMVNTDPRALRLFISWVRSYLDPCAEFTLGLHLHDGNDENEARAWWSNALGIQGGHFYKTFFKPAGTGHRKNRWLHGVCRVQMKRSADAHHRTMQWIECIAKEMSEPPADTIVHPGR
jgi:hypothetical protein